jgi:hypothetical protein
LQVVDCKSHEQEAQSASLKQVWPKLPGPGVQPEPLELLELLLELLDPEHMPAMLTHSVLHAVLRQLAVESETEETGPQLSALVQKSAELPWYKQPTRQAQLMSFQQST